MGLRWEGGRLIFDRFDSIRLKVFGGAALVLIFVLFGQITANYFAPRSFVDNVLKIPSSSSLLHSSVS